MADRPWNRERTIKVRVTPQQAEEWKRAAELDRKHRTGYDGDSWHQGHGELSAFIRRTVSARATELLCAHEPPADGGHKRRSRNGATNGRPGVQGRGHKHQLVRRE